jgi:hypothetical protein
VICGPYKCKYDNKCLAKLNNFKFSRDCYYDVVEYCPDVDAYCDNYYKPVICGWYECEYDNICWAKANGFKSGECYNKKW